MATVHEVVLFLEELAPPRLAEEWDNVGLLVGDRERTVERLMTCLTVTPASAEEAVRRGADLIVTHHPLPFRPLKRLTTDTLPGRLLLQLIRGGVGLYSPHTAFDSAADGINQRLAELLGLCEIRPLVTAADDPQGLGAGRWGRLPEREPLEAVAGKLKQRLSLQRVQLVGAVDRSIGSAAVGCGSAGQFLSAALSVGCDLLVVGETGFHTCLEAEAEGLALLLPGHYASERFAVESLAETLASHFGQLEVWASRDESDPLKWL
jgi:dinuclear metal center YbgI/SA1388 family protein